MDIRKIILDELHRQGRSRYWLAEHPGCGINKNSIYIYLRGETEGHGSTIAAMLTALRLRIVPDPRVPAGKRKPRRSGGGHSWDER